MTVTTTPATSTTTTLRPRYEGSNICTWIGFKHVNYLVEEAVLDWFRQRGTPARDLFEVHGLGLDLVDLDTRILHALHMDDEVEATVTPVDGDDDRLRFTVVVHVDRPGGRLKAVTSKVAVVLRTDAWHDAPTDPPPAAYARAVVGAPPAGRRVELADADAARLEQARPGGRGTVTSDVPAALRSGTGPAVAWTWRTPYPYCHFTVRAQLSGLLRNMEEVVDLFLAERGASIRTLLDEQAWIPVVPHSRVTWTGELLMEETAVTVFEVEQVFKDLTYTARCDTWVHRDGGLELVATGRITHGYAVIEGRSAWSLVPFDARLLAAVGAP